MSRHFCVDIAESRHYLRGMRIRTRDFSMRCSEEFLAQLRTLHQAAADTGGRVSRTDILHELVSKEAELLKPTVPEVRRIAEADDGALEGDL